ncbi:MAG TPA: SpoIID/LytB domain-containing protein [Clostridiales bacterium]|nr:SpoIID/LytB domain-containing protein [Clostridiales bacterium]
MIKINFEIVYFNTPQHPELESHFSYINQQFISTIAESKRELLLHLQQAVARSYVIFTVGGFNTPEFTPAIIAKAVDLPCNEETNCPVGSKVLYSDTGKLCGCIIESGNQSIIMLSEDPHERDVALDSVERFIENKYYIKREEIPAFVGAAPILQDRSNEKALTESSLFKEDQTEGPYGQAVTQKALFYGFESYERSSKKKVIRTVAAIVLSALIVVGGFFGYDRMYLPAQADSVYLRAYSLYGLGEISDDFPLEMLEKFGKLYSINPDLVGWVSLPNTKISYPVVTCANKSEKYYNSHLFDGSFNRYGTPYTHLKITKDSYQRNLTVFAKNTGDGRMFSDLSKYLDINFYKSSPILSMDTLFTENNWKIFSVFKYSENPPVDYAKTSFFNDAEFMDHLKKLSACSIYSTPVDLNSDDDILTLAANGEEYTVVVTARKVRKGESAYVDVERVDNNPVNPDSSSDLSSYISSSIYSSTVTESEDSDSAELPAHMEKELQDEQNIGGGSGGFIEQPPPLTEDEVRSNLPSSSQPSSEPSSNTPTSYPSGGTGETSSQTSQSSDISSSPDSSDAKSQPSSGPTSSEPTSSELPTPEPVILSVKNQYTGKIVTGNATDIIAQIIEAEMGSGFHIEALKAQAVATYSWLLCNGAATGKTPSVPMKEPGQKAIEAANAVAGLRVLYNGQVAQAYYFAISAGYTANCEDIWVASLPYLKSVESSVDKNVSQFQTIRSYKASDVQKWIKEEFGIDVSKLDKNEWFKCTYDANGLYVKTVTIGNQSFKGTVLRERLFTSSRVGAANVLRSSAYTISYNKEEDKFTFVVKGYGHGVGMSQVGANAYAKSGWTFEQILKHYYTGVTIG